MKRFVIVLSCLLFIFPVFALPEKVEDENITQLINKFCDLLDKEAQNFYMCKDRTDVFKLVNKNQDTWSTILTIPQDEFYDDNYPVFVMICKEKDSIKYSGLILYFEGYKMHLLEAPL